jgi:hypothetical protein
MISPRNRKRQFVSLRVELRDDLAGTDDVTFASRQYLQSAINFETQVDCVCRSDLPDELKGCCAIACSHCDQSGRPRDRSILILNITFAACHQ